MNLNRIPIRRFPEFCESDSYKQYRFEDIFTFSSGKNIKQNEASPEYTAPCVRYGELYHLYGEVITKIINRTNLDPAELKFSNGDEILLPSAGEDPLDIGSASALTLKNVAIGRTINVLRPNGTIDYSPIYVSFYINEKLKKKISTLARGASISNVYNSDLKCLAINLPCIEEQEKIANFLSTVDEKIRLLKEKHALLQQYKKGVMQKLFSQEIRFKDDKGQAFPDWTEKRFGTCFERVTRKNKIDNRNVLTISAQHGLINQEKYFNKSVSAADVTGYYLLNKGEFAYNKSYSKGYPMGAIKRLNNYDQGVVSTLYICFKSINNQCDLFWEQFFEGGMLNRQISKIAQEGARNHGLLNVSVTEFFHDMKVTVPCVDEQKKIAEFLQILDKKLDAVQQQIDLTQTFKKGLLQQMFV